MRWELIHIDVLRPLSENPDIGADTAAYVIA
jgi:hypothetical protein